MATALHTEAAHRAAAALLAGDAGALLALLAPGATFHSPVADYDDAARIAQILGALTQVLTGAHPADPLYADGALALPFTATVEGRPADGLLRVRVDGSGRIADLTLFVRPLRSLLAGLEAMQRLVPRAA